MDKAKNMAGKAVKKHFKKWLIIWGGITAISVGIAVAIAMVVFTILGGSQTSDDSLDGVDGSTYSPELIQLAAKAMNADPSDEFVSNLEQVIMNESGGIADRNQEVVDMNTGVDPAVGILQYTGQTFNYYALEGHNSRTNALDELLAFFNNSDWKNSIGWTTIMGVRKMEWLHSGPQGTPRFKKVPGDLDMSKANALMDGSAAAGNGELSRTTSIGKITWTAKNNTYPSDQCTWWAKAREPWAGNYWGNGCQWGMSAAAAGYKVNSTPEAGAIVSFAAGQLVGTWRADSQYGHVAVVEKVSGDSITISQGGGNFEANKPNIQTISGSIIHDYVYIHNVKTTK